MRNSKNGIAATLALSAFFGFLAVFFFLGAFEIKTANKDLFNQGFIALINFASIAVGYYLGSSFGSARKNDLLSPVAAGATIIAGEALKPYSPAGDEKGFVRPGLLAVLAGLALGLAMTACATMKTDPPEVVAGKSLLAMKATIITAATAGDEMCRQRSIAPAVCMALANYYQKAQPAYDLAADSLRAVLLAKGPDAWRNYMRDQAIFRDIFDDVLLFSSQYGLLGGAK